MPIEERDRRRHQRHGIVTMCKIYHPASRRFAAGRTKDLSASGALLCVETARPLLAGEAIDLAISLDPKPLLASTTMIRSKVIRSLPIGDTAQELAVEFDRLIDVAQAA
ncbi:MAG: PilZ domain-containing protein [Phycisphaerales bacterium]